MCCCNSMEVSKEKWKLLLLYIAGATPKAGSYKESMSKGMLEYQTISEYISCLECAVWFFPCLATPKL